MQTSSTAAAVSSAQSCPDKSQGRFYRPELDVLRFFAFLMVFLHHGLPEHARNSLVFQALLSFRDAGAFGVCLFFLLSSYLISELLLREQRKTGNVHIQSFYIRRILRIWPLYFFMLLFGYAAGLAHFTAPITLGRLGAFLLLAGNWYTGIFGYGSNIIFPLWSISVEEQFYMLWPTVARKWRKSGLLGAAIALWIISFVALAVLCKQQSSLNTSIWTNSFVQFQFLALGGFLAVALDGRIPRRSNIRVPLLLSGIACYFVADFVFHIKRADAVPSLPETIPGYFILGLGTIFLFFGVLGAQTPKFMRPLVYLGKISYGLYVFHTLAFLIVHRVLASRLHGMRHDSIVVIPIGLVLTISLAIASYRFLESPFLKLKERFTFVRSRAV